MDTNPIDHPRTYAALMEASDADGAHEVCELCAKLEEENTRWKKAAEAWGCETPDNLSMRIDQLPESY